MLGTTPSALLHVVSWRCIGTTPSALWHVVYVTMYLFDFEFRLEYVSSDHTWARACIYYTGISLLDKNMIWSIQRRLNNAYIFPSVRGWSKSAWSAWAFESAWSAHVATMKDLDFQNGRNAELSVMDLNFENWRSEKIDVNCYIIIMPIMR